MSKKLEAGGELLEDLVVESRLGIARKSRHNRIIAKMTGLDIMADMPKKTPLKGPKEKLKKPLKVVIKKIPRTPGPGRGLLGQAVLAIVIFLILSSIYSLVTNVGKEKNEVSLSQLSSDV